MAGNSTKDNAADGHVYPVDDLMPHIYTRACWCKPRLEEVEDSDAKVVIHNSADGREGYELLLESSTEQMH